ncbi:hypothetical protein [Nostoc sp.]|uniref:hypothetical protein n=1 Tax=Nostoc sp. TaxID=1180 RepID=UPI002FF4B1FA
MLSNFGVFRKQNKLLLSNFGVFRKQNELLLTQKQLLLSNFSISRINRKYGICSKTIADLPEFSQANLYGVF